MESKIHISKGDWIVYCLSHIWRLSMRKFNYACLMQTKAMFLKKWSPQRFSTHIKDTRARFQSCHTSFYMALLYTRSQPTMKTSRYFTNPTPWMWPKRNHGVHFFLNYVVSSFPCTYFQFGRFESEYGINLGFSI